MLASLEDCCPSVQAFRVHARPSTRLLVSHVLDLVCGRRHRFDHLPMHPCSARRVAASSIRFSMDARWTCSTPPSAVASVGVAAPSPTCESSATSLACSESSSEISFQHSCSLPESASSFSTGLLTSCSYPRSCGALPRANHNKQSCPRQLPLPRHATMQSVAGPVTLLSMDCWITDMCSGQDVMMMCCATEKDGRTSWNTKGSWNHIGPATQAHNTTKSVKFTSRWTPWFCRIPLPSKREGSCQAELGDDVEN